MVSCLNLSIQEPVLASVQNQLASSVFFKKKKKKKKKKNKKKKNSC